jgi:hypothetical protein
MVTHIITMLRNVIITQWGITDLLNVEKYTRIRHGFDMHGPKREKWT